MLHRAGPMMTDVMAGYRGINAIAISIRVLTALAANPSELPGGIELALVLWQRQINAMPIWPSSSRIRALSKGRPKVHAGGGNQWDS